jgi:hypothetical protein
MKASRFFVLLAGAFISTLVLATPPRTNSKTEVLRGWLSDEQCAKGRAEGGTYTATNPSCAKECVAKGKKIVFVDPQGKRVLVISNPDIAKKNVGDEVEITGQVDAQAKTLHAESLKFLEKGSATCAAPAKKKTDQ